MVGTAGSPDTAEPRGSAAQTGPAEWVHRRRNVLVIAMRGKQCTQFPEPSFTTQNCGKGRRGKAPNLGDEGRRRRLVRDKPSTTRVTGLGEGSPGSHRAMTATRGF